MSNYTILTHENHPLYKSLEKDEHIIHYYSDQSKFVEQVSKSKQVNVLIDLTFLRTQEKDNLLLKLKHNAPFDLKVISDMSIAWGGMLMKKYPFIYAASPLSFYSPTQNYEVAIADENVRDALAAFFKKYEFQIHEVSQAGLGFTYPRTLAQIVNEAYFALEEGLCSREDLDRAMKNGVNYPHGPLEWSEKVGKAPICELLDELYAVTGDPRYRAQTQLRMEAKLET